MYQKYQQVKKLGSTEVEGILNGRCFIYPKLDGTNGHVWRIDGILRCGSRNRELVAGEDNAGFREWVYKNEQSFHKLFDQLPEGAHVYGEWLIPHTIKNYEKSAWRNFYIFDILIDGKYIAPTFDDFKVIPVMEVIDNPTMEQLEALVKQNTYLLKDGVGEGIIIKNYDFCNRYGNVVWAKVINTEFKVKNKTPDVPEELFANIIDKHLCEKEFAKLTLTKPWNRKMTSCYLGMVYHSLVTEHIWSFIQKQPTINFKLLKKLAHTRVKELMPELF